MRYSCRCLPSHCPGRSLIASLMGVVLLLSMALPSRAITYAQVTDIKTRQLTNGVQITWTP